MMMARRNGDHENCYTVSSGEKIIVRVSYDYA